MEEKTLTIKATTEVVGDEETMATVMEFQGIEDSDSETAAHLMFGILNRIAYEWMLGGMEPANCFNLFLHAARNAEFQVEEKRKENGLN